MTNANVNTLKEKITRTQHTLESMRAMLRELARTEDAIRTTEHDADIFEYLGAYEEIESTIAIEQAKLSELLYVLEQKDNKKNKQKCLKWIEQQKTNGEFINIALELEKDINCTPAPAPEKEQISKEENNCDKKADQPSWVGVVQTIKTSDKPSSKKSKKSTKKTNKKSNGNGKKADKKPSKTTEIRHIEQKIALLTAQLEKAKADKKAVKPIREQLANAHLRYAELIG